MRLAEVEMIEVALPLVRPFRTSFGTSTVRHALLLRVLTSDGVEGWAECAADPEPLYSEEFLAAAELVLSDHLVPRLLGSPELFAEDVADLLAPVAGHPMAKAALETAVLDAELRRAGVSMAERFGAVRTHVPAGVSVGIADSIDELLEEVAGYLAAGYERIKLKIEPGWDMEPVRRVREAFGDITLQVDANAAYRLDRPAHLEALHGLDEFDLLLLEQPLAGDDLVDHAALARRISTPICLDESIRSVRHARAALTLGAAGVINVKPARVGGYLEAVRIHDVALAAGVPVWCGGMLETGIGRAANLALAALPGFTLPGDVSASDRYYTHDVTAPFVLRDGGIDVPVGAGIGVAVDVDAVAACTRRRRSLFSSRELG